MELRTDEHGTVRAAKGLFVSADAQPKGEGGVLDMAAALQDIEQLERQLEQLNEAAKQAEGIQADVDAQIAMFNDRLKPLNEVLHFSAPQGVVFTSGEDMQLAAANNVIINAGGDISAGVMGNMTALTGEKLGLFARTGQLSLKSGEGPVEMQAQNANLRFYAGKKFTLTSTEDILFAGKKRITLIGGGSYLRIDAGKIEYGTTGIYQRRVKRTSKRAKDSISVESLKQMKMVTQYFDRKIRFSSDVVYQIEALDGKVLASGNGDYAYVDKHDEASEYWVFFS